MSNSNFSPFESNQSATILYYQSFSTGNHGGTKRSRQIAHSLRIAKKSVVEVVPEKSFFILASALLKFPFYFVRYFRYGLTVRGLIKASILHDTLCKLVNVASDIVVETDRNRGILLALVAARLGLRVTACPHNVEFLVPDRSAGNAFRNLAALQRCEIGAFRAANRILAISHFDKAVIDCLVECCELLPFRPVEADAARLEAIRRSRVTRSRTGTVLCLGSVGNPPTMAAFQKYLPDLAGVLDGKVKLVVAGTGTESLRPQLPAVTVLGAVSDAELTSLLERADVAVIPVRQTSGFLTRLAELNAAGLPTIVLGEYLDASLSSYDNMHHVLSINQCVEKINALMAIYPDRAVIQ